MDEAEIARLVLENDVLRRRNDELEKRLAESQEYIKELIAQIK
jgi:regulator of replication initiation timing